MALANLIIMSVIFVLLVCLIAFNIIKYRAIIKMLKEGKNIDIEASITSNKKTVKRQKTSKNKKQ